MYATPADLRAEGVTEAMAPDARLLALLDEATATIDRVTGWFFEPRLMTLTLDGRGTPSLEPPAVPIRVYRLTVGGALLPVTPDALLVVGAPVAPGFDAPRICLLGGRVFPKGRGNVLVAGMWGYTEVNGTTVGRIPLAIRRACMLLVLRHLSPLADDASLEARTRWRVVEERTRDQSYRLDPIRKTGLVLTGDPEVDALLLPYLRPSPLGAA